jgi:diguanylate cyclase (GGDEF)-like protein
MEELLLLWRWSTGIQTVSILLITAFLTLNGRGEGGAVLADWARAWQWNCLALSTSWYFWFFRPSGLEADLVRMVYCASKSAFLIYLIAGVLGFVAPGWLQRMRARLWLLPVGIGLLAGPLIEGLALVGLTQSSLIALACFGGVALCTHARALGLEWLGLGLLLRGLLAVAEAWGYGQQYFLADAATNTNWRVFLAAHSSLDLVAEWTIALGCMLALARRTQRALAASNAALRDSEQALRDQAERDALTGLHNRHGLPALLEDARERGAWVLFFDLDDFKRVNDEAGHAAGDECLQAVATALRRHFRREDAVLRFAGDEFLVLTAPTDADAVQARVQAVADELAQHREPCAIHFSVGAAWLSPGGDPLEALRRADAAMYEDKQGRNRQAELQA